MDYFIFVIIGIGLGLIGIFYHKKVLVKLQTENENIKKEKQELKTNNVDLQDQVLQLRDQKTKLETEQAGFQKNLEFVKKELKLEFQETAKSLFEENAKNSEKNISHLINPLQNNLHQFKERMNKVHGESQKERVALESELKRIYNIANDFDQVLRGGSHTQGGFGEVVLENVLEASGLRKGEEFILQGEGLSLKTEEGGNLKPDATVLLPDEKHIMIDSKVSLTDYFKYREARTDAEREEFAKNVASSVERHIKNLSEKYSSLEKSPDFTLMFFPEEGAFTLALQTNRDLYQKAWRKGIVIVGPTTLFATLRIIHSIWKTERQNKNAKEIAIESGRLYDKFVGFLNDMEEIDKSLQKATDSYNSALSKLSAGRGNLTSKAEKIKRLGAQADKNLPDKFLQET